MRFGCLGLAVLLASCAGLERVPDCVTAGRFMSALAANGVFQGAFVIGTRDGKRCEGAYGMADIEAKATFTSETASDGASITKTLTAAALLALAEEGRVDLEAPVQRYLPGYPHAGTRVRHLISHSAGLPLYDCSTRNSARASRGPTPRSSRRWPSAAFRRPSTRGRAINTTTPPTTRRRS